MRTNQQNDLMSVFKKIFRRIVDFGRKQSSKKGFTIVEVVVTTLIFSIITIEVSGIFIQILNLERRGFAVQKIQENSLFALEAMARLIRVSQITTVDNNCTASSLDIVHPVSGNVRFVLNNGAIQVVTAGVTANITSSDVIFTRLNFCVKGSPSNDNQTPRVAILTSIQNKTGKEIFQFDIQTTVSSRDVRSEFQSP